jgi:DNA-binding LytR/AlgR family response regulator
MNCIIVEDQPPAQRILKKYIEDIGYLQLMATFNDAIQAMAYLNAHRVDLMFLDIHLPKMSGMDFLKTLPNPPHIILTTAFPDYALESYEFDVVDYLLKPFSFQRFVKAVSRIPLTSSPEPAPTQQAAQEIFIKSGYEHIKIVLDEILYIKSDADYTELYMPDKKQLSSEPLRHWSETLSPGHFIQIHKSYIVNASKIQKITSAQVHLEHGHVLPIGRAYKDELFRRII